MKRIHDTKRITAYLKDSGLSACFSDHSLPFELYTFTRGEILNNSLDPYDHICFLLEGDIRICHIRDDGTPFEIAVCSGLTCLGDIEFASGVFSSHIIETMTPAVCLALPLAQCRSVLENDPVFLRFILHSIANKIIGMSNMISMPSGLRERVLYYMRMQCPGGELRSVLKASQALACSQRQLLRILKDLCREKTVEHTGHGRYQLV